ncbi:MAG: hypothetical protein LBJ95_02195 [Oscillospiraceae bacterium]|nr:hypothetical protein [Oscillospiraceae bacterium]
MLKLFTKTLAIFLSVGMLAVNCGAVLRLCPLLYDDEVEDDIMIHNPNHLEEHPKLARVGRARLPGETDIEYSNRTGLLIPAGIMMHSTAMPGVTPQELRDQWNVPTGRDVGGPFHLRRLQNKTRSV